MTYHDGEFGKRNRERPNFDRPSKVHYQVSTPTMLCVAATALIGIMIWMSAGDAPRTPSPNAPSGSNMRTTSVPVAPTP